MEEEKINKREPCPAKKANFLSWMLFCWLNPLLRTGNKRTLETDDLYNVTEEDSSDCLSKRLEKNWNVELLKLKSGKQPSLRVALWKTFGFRFLLWGFFAFAVETLRIVQPVLLGGLIQFFSPGSEIQPWEGYLYAAGVSLCSIIPAFSFHVYTLVINQYGMWMRIAISSLVYKKCLRLSGSALSQTSVGQIVNLMSNDAQKMDTSVVTAHYLLLGPMQLFAVSVILWYRIYWAVVAGMVVLILMLPFSGILGRIFARLRHKTALRTDERVRLTNEMLNSMRIVKMYCWEKLFKGLIDKARKHETTTIMQASHAKAMAMAPFFYAAKLIAYFTFLTYILMGYKLTAEVVFVTLSLYTPVRMAITFYLPIGMQWGSEALITVGRMQEFLLMEERTQTKSTNSKNVEEKDENKKITVNGIKASWDQSLPNSVLRDISFEVKPGELLIVIGAVGAGKSSLLMAILGELPLVEGNIDIGGKIAYVSQQAWVFGASVRENILFGEKFDATKYGHVVEAAALKRDFELMSEGDQTLVGDRGVSLSGGQKARISLARSLYRDGDIYLLDDPLSAVDAHVSNHLFHKCICGHLKSKARILITHQLQYLKSADKILVLDANNRVQLGTFDELIKHGVDFARLIKHDSEDFKETHKATKKEGRPMENGHSQTPKKTDEFENQWLIKSLLSKSYADVRKTPSGDLKSMKPLLSQSMDLGKHFKKSQTVGTLASYVSAISLPAPAEMDPEEYVPQIQTEEARSTGTVSPKLYIRLFYVGGGLLGLILFFFLNIVAQVSFILVDWWLAYWCNSIEIHELKMKQLHAANDTFTNFTSFTSSFAEEMTTAFGISSEPFGPFPGMLTYLHIFTGLTAAVVLFGILRALHGFHIVVQASKAYHTRMLGAILRCPISFFDQNPIGRILNRFSKDLGQVDEVLPFLMYDFIQCLLLIIGVFFVVGITNPWVIIAMLPLVILFALLRRYFLKTIRNIKRIEATTKSPIFSHLSSTILGIQTIHAYEAENAFTEQFYSHQDLHTSAYFLFLALVRWFALRLECICAAFITVVAFCAVFASQSMNGSMVGLSLNYSMTLMMLFQWGVRQSSEVESHMTSVERIVEYSELPSEAPLESAEENRPSPDWPQDGGINGENVYLRYKEDGPSVLDNLNFTIYPSEKIGIVGRTGAGKSSLISLLFRLVEPGGRLSIDEVQITKLGLHDLRQKISIIPQDPVLLTGTVRKNLDPLNNHSDMEVWHSLKQVQLDKVVEDMRSGLESEIQEGGANLSMGQRQLFCLARAILKCNKILVIDEATANVDQRTDALIQNTIREQFAHCTVLTIAHRLNTIIDSDRIMVLDAGRIVEFDVPHSLLQVQSGYFYKMAEQTGPTEFAGLKESAKVAFETSRKQSPVKSH